MTIHAMLEYIGKRKAPLAVMPSAPGSSKLRRAIESARRQLSMPSSYQGSVAGYVVGLLGYNLRQQLKRLRFFGAVRGAEDPALAQRRVRYRQHIERREWDAVLSETLAIGAVAEQKRNATLMLEMGAALERLRAYPQGAELRLKSRQVRKGAANKEWRGQSLAGRVLLIDLAENVKTSMGSVLRHARLIAQAAANARQTIVLAEPRLVPLLRRSFPNTDVRAGGAGDAAAHAEADVTAGIEQLVAFLVPDEERIAKSFVPLRVDRALTAEFRARYRDDGLPVIGISWSSKSYAKDLPSLPEWAELLRGIEARYVSLQYGKTAPDIARLQRHLRQPIIDDASVDQLVDMDRFAAQVASLDAVISISNTAAHLAGALDVPSVFIVDDRFHTVWPVIGDSTPWYPRAALVAKRGRPWPMALADVHARLSKRLAARPDRRRTDGV
jgi:hypothetical protein